MSSWRALLHVILFCPWLWLYNNVSVLIIFAGWQVPGLVTREFLNLITGDAPARMGIPTILGAFVAAGLARTVGYYGVYASNRPLMFSIATLLQKNMLTRILKRPGACALSDSPGEAISRFRGDVDELRYFPLGINDLVGSTLFSTVAIVILLRIDALITLVTFLPMVLVVAVTHLASQRIHAYRLASRKAAHKQKTRPPTHPARSK